MATARRKATTSRGVKPSAASSTRAAKPRFAGGGKFGSVKEAKKRLKSGGGDTFIKYIPKDEEITVRFLTEPDEWVGYLEVWEDSSGMYRPLLDGEDAPPGRFGPSKRVLANVLDVEQGQVVPLKLPSDLANRLVDRYEKRGTLTDRDYELMRSGEGRDTRYDMDPGESKRIKLDRYKLIDLEQLLEKVYNLAMNGEDDDDDDDDYEDEEDFDDVDDEEEEDERPVRKPRVSKTAPKKDLPGRRRNIPVEDDEDEDEDDDEFDDDEFDDLDDDGDDFDLDDDDEDDDEDEDEDDIEIDLDELPSMKITELRNLASDIGLKIKSTKKQPYIDAIKKAVS